MSSGEKPPALYRQSFKAMLTQTVYWRGFFSVCILLIICPFALICPPIGILSLFSLFPFCPDKYGRSYFANGDTRLSVNENALHIFRIEPYTRKQVLMLSIPWESIVEIRSENSILTFKRISEYFLFVRAAGVNGNLAFYPIVFPGGYKKITLPWPLEDCREFRNEVMKYLSKENIFRSFVENHTETHA